MSRLRVGGFLVGAFALSCALSCAPKGRYVWVSEVPPAQKSPVKLRPGDKVQLVVHGQDTISGEFEVRPEGELIVPVAGKFAAAGMTVDQLGTTVERKLQGVLANPLVTAAISLKRANAISVLGEVRTPGHLEVPNGEGVMDALARVGGLTEFADANAIFVIRRANNALRIRFRYDDLAGGDQKSLAFRLEDGDLIVVE